MDKTSVKWMSLNELRKFMLSKDFRNSNWASDCLFPAITHHNLDDHPLVVAQKIESRRWLPMVMGGILIGLSVYGLGKLWVNPEIEHVFVPHVQVVYFFGLLFCFLEYKMTPDEKRSLKECLKRWAQFERMTDESLLVSIKRWRSTMEHIVESALVIAAKELTKIERENTLARSKGQISSFSLEKEARARERFEDYHLLARSTNLISSKEYGPYFKMAEDELSKEEAAKK